MGNTGKRPLYPVIMSGGAGTRLWPVSRELHPKPFIRLQDGESLLQKTFKRVAALPEVKDVLTVTNRELYFRTEGEYHATHIPHCARSYILEPIGRNTAPAIAMASMHAAHKYGGDAVLLVLPADHLMADANGFETAVQQAMQLAQQGRIVTFGIRPTYPETGYGYIKASGTQVLRFVEKPTRELAETYIAEGNYWWNAGIFCFTAETMLKELELLQPDIYAHARSCYEEMQRSKSILASCLELPAEGFAMMPDISIDYAIMERTSAVAVVPCEIGWNDIGNWAALSGTAEADESGNRIVGDAVVYDASNCFIQSQHRMAGVVGVEDLIVIDTPDALLVTRSDRAQDVKHIVSHLREKDHDACKRHREVHRPWGTYTVIEEGAGYKIKRITVNPHASLSLQLHRHRSEHWVVIAGVALVENGDKVLTLHANQSIYIPPGRKHRLENASHEPLVIIEVQSGSLLCEEDIVRFEDGYGRV